MTKLTKAQELEIVTRERDALRAAICWVSPPFVDQSTPEAELRQRIMFAVQDASRAEDAAERSRAALADGEGL